jgi:tetratricopeptide (TPR) repeat protein
MPTPFLSSEEYDERAHQLYNEGQYDEALDVLREGLALYPHAVELHIGVGYARLAREEYAWARRSFEEAVVLDGDHEDALAGMGETLLKLGRVEDALRHFRRVIELGYQDDIDLMLQVGRALFRHDRMDEAREFFELAVQEAPESAEAVACLAYALHRIGDEDGSIGRLRRALQLDDDHVEARIYLANILYDRGDYERSLRHLERTTPEDHWDELGIWRLMELKKSINRVRDDDPELRPWEERLGELGGEPDDIDEMLAEIESRAAEEPHHDVQGQLELFGSLLSTHLEREAQDAPVAEMETIETLEIGERQHRVLTADGRQYAGSWEEIVKRMRDAASVEHGSLQDFMVREARRMYSARGITIPTHDAESFIRASASAGLLRIVR